MYLLIESSKHSLFHDFSHIFQVILAWNDRKQITNGDKQNVLTTISQKHLRTNKKKWNQNAQIELNLVIT